MTDHKPLTDSERREKAYRTLFFDNQKCMEAGSCQRIACMCAQEKLAAELAKKDAEIEATKCPYPPGKYRVIDGELCKIEPGIPPQLMYDGAIARLEKERDEARDDAKHEYGMRMLAEKERDAARAAIKELEARCEKFAGEILELMDQRDALGLVAGAARSVVKEFLSAYSMGVVLIEKCKELKP